MSPSNWKDILANSNTNIQDILNQFSLNIGDFYDKPLNIDNFPIKVTPSFLKKIKPHDPNDPILKQILPSKSELLKHQDYTYDPLLESQSNPKPGLLHKFHGRALITMTGSCAIHCRYCFRKYFDYQTNNISKNNRETIKNYLTTNDDIFEVILSGGDPLINSDRFLGEFIQMLSKIPSLTTLRIHSRIPVVLPERITPELLTVLSSTHLTKVLVIHTNHPQELDEQTNIKIKSLRDIGFTVFNQSVLLAGINDHPDPLIELSKNLFSFGVIPYYLNMLDQVAGSQKFHVEKQVALNIYQKMLEKLPGYLVPKLVQEQPGALYKTHLFTS